MLDRLVSLFAKQKRGGGVLGPWKQAIEEGHWMEVVIMGEWGGGGVAPSDVKPTIGVDKRILWHQGMKSQAP